MSIYFPHVRDIFEDMIIFIFFVVGGFPVFFFFGGGWSVLVVYLANAKEPQSHYPLRYPSTFSPFPPPPLLLFGEFYPSFCHQLAHLACPNLPGPALKQIEDALRSINEQLRDAKDDRRMTKHQEKMAECLEVQTMLIHVIHSHGGGVL